MEELAQQSKINYTVVEDSPYYEYFKNMAGAEEDLYKYDISFFGPTLNFNCLKFKEL